MIVSNNQAEYFQERIREFWNQFGRKDLPWRQTRNPWKLLIAEILLRKTTAAQAVGVYGILSQLTPSDVSRIEMGELEKALMPLGIYKVRAGQLKGVASAVANVTDEQYNDDHFLRSLPGVGKYISNSVRCCAFDCPVPALDANMIRVLQRVFGLTTKRRRPREDRELWDFAGTLVPTDDCREYNWGVLDFGALVCTHHNPKCTECPMTAVCTYYRTERDSFDENVS